MIKFGTQDKDFFPNNFEDKFNYVKSIGFEGFEIDGKALLDNFDEIQEAIKKTGLPVITACGGYRGWIGDFDENKRKQGLEDIEQILKALSKIGGKGIVVPAAWGMHTFRLPPMESPRSLAEDERVVSDSLTWLDKVAQTTGTTIFLEPLNRYQDHMINTVEQANYYIEKYKLENVKVIADFYHMNIDEDNISATFRKYKDVIKHIHIADNHRFQPGTGSIDFEEHFKTLIEVNYSGFIVFEGRVRGINHRNAYEKSIEYVQNILKKAEKDV